MADVDEIGVGVVAGFNFSGEVGVETVAVVREAAEEAGVDNVVLNVNGRFINRGVVVEDNSGVAIVVVVVVAATGVFDGSLEGFIRRGELIDVLVDGEVVVTIELLEDAVDAVFDDCDGVEDRGSELVVVMASVLVIVDILPVLVEDA